MRLTPRQKLIAASAVSATLLTGYVWFFWFVASGVMQNNAVRADIVARLDGFARDRSRAQGASALRAERHEDITRLLGFFVDRARPIAFLQMLEGIGRATGSAVVIEVDDAASDEAHLGFRVIVEGGGQNSMIRFVRLLERLPAVITVTQISEEKKSPDTQVGSGPPDRLVVSLRVRTQ